jgi:hypothetical protein
VIPKAGLDEWASVHEWIGLAVASEAAKLREAENAASQKAVIEASKAASAAARIVPATKTSASASATP